MEKSEKNYRIIMGRLLNYPECCVQYFANEEWRIEGWENEPEHKSEGCEFRTCKVHNDFTPEELFELMGRRPPDQHIINWRGIHNNFDRTGDWSKIKVKIKMQDVVTGERYFYK